MGIVTAQKLTHVYNSLDMLPSFLIPVLGNRPTYFVQDGSIKGGVEGFLPIEFDSDDEEQLHPLPQALQREVRIGDPILCTFGLTKDRIFIAPSLEMAQMLQVELPTLADYPNLCVTIERFIAEARG